MDVLRGIAILLVIVYHPFTFVEQNTAHEFARLGTFNEAMQPVRMPALFFLSGLLVPRSLAKGTRTYIEGKLRRVAWPYFLWSALMVAMFWVGSVVSSWVYAPQMWLQPLYDPLVHLWFLGYLLLYFAVALLMSLGIPSWVLAFGSLVLVGMPIDGRWGGFWTYAAFFFLGVVVGERRGALDALIGRFWPCVGLAVTSVFVLVWGAVGELRMPGIPWNFMVILAFVVGVAGALRPVANTTLLAPIRYVGRHSIVFYIIHWPVAYFALGEIAKVGDVHPRTQLAVGVIVGLTVSACVALISQRIAAVNVLFEWPKRRTSAQEPLLTRERVDAQAR